MAKIDLISINDRPPADFQRVLLFSDTTGTRIEIGYRRPNGAWVLDADELEEVCMPCLTHWAELPEEPKTG